MPSKPAPDRFLNIHEVAEMIGLHWTTIRDRKCGTGEIPRIKLSNKCVRFSLNAVQVWMATKVREAEEAQRRQESVVNNLMASKEEIRKAVDQTYLTIVNGGKYR